jgi:hypothetical protein
MARNYVNLAEIYGAIDQSRANQMQMENARMQQEAMRNQMARQQRADAQEEGIRGVYRGATSIDADGNMVLDDKKVVTGLAGYAPEKALEYQQGITKRKGEESKIKREEAKFELEDMAERTKQARDIAAGIYDDASFEAAKPMLQKIAPQMPLPERFDAKWRDNITLTADGRLKQIESQLGRDVTMRGQEITMRGQDISSANSRRGQDITLRGQNLANERANERLNFDRSGGTAAVNAANGTTTKTEKLTEGMRNNAMYAQRMVASEKLLEGNEEQKPTLSEKGLAFSETASNASRSPARRQALQAQRDWVRAKLRKESGAAIGKDEMENEILTYFPQIGDDPGTIEQKRLARLEATNGLIQSSGAAYQAPVQNDTQNIIPKNAPMPAKPKLGAVQSGYVYTGGDPSKPTSWKKK